jgi:hypothetical protein
MKKPSVLKATGRTVALLFVLFFWVPLLLWSQTEQHRFDVLIKRGAAKSLELRRQLFGKFRRAQPLDTPDIQFSSRSL